MPQLGCSPAPHSPPLPGLEFYQRGHSRAHGLAWLWAIPRALASAGAVAAYGPLAALLLVGVVEWVLAAKLFPDGVPCGLHKPRESLAP